MKSYFRVMLGGESAHAKACVEGGFIGADFRVRQSLAEYLGGDARAFSEAVVPIYLSTHPDKSKIAAVRNCGALWSVAKEMQPGDVILSPNGEGRYLVGEISGGYSYVPDGILPHRRAVRWHEGTIAREAMSQALRNSCGIGTVRNITAFADEITRLLGGAVAPARLAGDATEDAASATTFALEKHLEDFLVENWAQAELGKTFDIYQQDGEMAGQQYPTDTGPLDLLCISKDKKTLLVLELKKGRASDAVVGQVLRYMGFVREQLAEEGQQVKGAIIALEDDQRIRRSLAMVPDVSFYRYEVSFRLVKGG